LQRRSGEFPLLRCWRVFNRPKFKITRILARVCYDKKKFTKSEVADGKIFVRYGAFSQMHDGRFEKIEQIRIQYYHVVLKAAGQFFLSEYSKPAAMMTWDEQTQHVWVGLLLIKLIIFLTRGGKSLKILQELLGGANHKPIRGQYYFRQPITAEQTPPSPPRQGTFRP
jgi:hypothetical protein